MVQEKAIEGVPAQSKSFSFDRKSFGRNGFFAKISMLEWPLFLPGTPNDWILFDFDEQNMVALAAKNVGIFTINTGLQFQSWLGYWESYTQNGQEIIFTGEGHPVEGCSPDKIKISLIQQRMFFAPASLAGDVNFEDRKLLSLDLV